MVSKQMRQVALELKKAQASRAAPGSLLLAQDPADPVRSAIMLLCSLIKPSGCPELGTAGRQTAFLSFRLTSPIEYSPLTQSMAF